MIACTARGSNRIIVTLSVFVGDAGARWRGVRQSKSVENQRRTDPTTILHPSHPPGRRSQSTRLMRLRRRGVWLSLLSHGRLALVCRRSCQADWKTTTSRGDVLFCSAASGRYRTVTLWVTRLQTATLRSISRRTEHAQQHVLDLITGDKTVVKGLTHSARHGHHPTRQLHSHRAGRGPEMSRARQSTRHTGKG